MMQRRPTTAATAWILAALLLAGAAGLGEAAVACLCRGMVETTPPTPAPSCCASAAAGEIFGWAPSGSGVPGCDDCVDQPLQAPPGKHAPPRPGAVGGEAVVCDPVDGRSRHHGAGGADPSAHGHRLALALLSSVIQRT